MRAKQIAKRFIQSSTIATALLATHGLAQQGGPQARPPQRQPNSPSGRDDSGVPIETNKGMTGVSVEAQKELKSLAIEGASQQVEQVLRIIEEIDKISGGAKPDIRVIRLKNADSEALVKLLSSIYAAREAARAGTTTSTANTAAAGHGKAGFVALAQPNAVIIVAQKNEIDEIAAFAQELDMESKSGLRQFHVFQLKNAPADVIQGRIKEFLALGESGTGAAGGGTGRTPAGLRMRAEVIADTRSNSLLVFAGPEDLTSIAKLIEQLDGAQPSSVNILRVFQLKNSIASDLANLLQSAIIARAQATNRDGAATTGGTQTANQAGGPFGQQGGNQAAQRGGQSTQSTTPATTGGLKSSRLRFYAPDKRTGKLVESGILEDITVSADDRSNSLLVTAPPTSMELMAELILQFDALPSPTAQLKVYKLQNADAQAMLTTLQQVFLGQQPSTTGGAFGAGNAFAATQNRQQNTSFAVGGVDSAVSLVPLTFSLDARTNSIIVSGAANDILAVEALLIKLDSNTERERKTIVYRLKNLSANDASTAIDTFLQQQAGTGTLTGAVGAANAANIAQTLQQQIRNEVSVVPEPTTNILIVSSTQRFFDEVVRIIDEIDTRPPQVLIQVLIADVALTDDQEFGIEIGVQADSLFDRSIAVSNSTLPTLTPGFNFNTTQPLPSGLVGNNNPDMVALQGLGNLALGRASTRNGFGGLIFSSSSENVSVLLRALKRQQRVDILSRPQIMALDNQSAFIQVGQSVPVINGTSVSTAGTTNNSFDYRDVGIILQVTPRINPDGTVIMRVEPQVSSLNPVGQPISTNLAGTVVATAPIIDITQASTTVTAMNGQTIVIGGLIRKDRNTDKHKIPILGDIPGIGWLGKTEFKFAIKRELIIVLTPQIVYGECDVQRLKDAEARKIGWNLNDVEKIHGSIGLTDYGKTYIGPSAMFKAKPQKSAPDPHQTPLRHSEKKKQKLDIDGNPMPEEDSSAVHSEGASSVPGEAPAPAPLQSTPPTPGAAFPPGPRPIVVPKAGSTGAILPGGNTMPTTDVRRADGTLPVQNGFATDIVVTSSADRPVSARNTKAPSPIYINAPLEKEETQEAKKPPKPSGLRRFFGSKTKEDAE